MVSLILNVGQSVNQNLIAPNKSDSKKITEVSQRILKDPPPSVGIVVEEMPAPAAPKIARNPITDAILNNDAQALIAAAHGKDINAPDSDGQTPLTLAVTYGHTGLIPVLIDQLGADPNCAGSAAPLTTAAFAHQMPAAQQLIIHGADPKMLEICDSDGQTPLTKAVALGDLIAVEILVKLGADIDQVDDNGFAPLELAVREKNPAMIRLLGKLGADPEAYGTMPPLLTGLVTKDKDLVALLLKEIECDPNFSDANFTLPYVEVGPDHEMLPLLIEYGTDLDLVEEVLLRKEVMHIWSLGGTSPFTRPDGKTIEIPHEFDHPSRARAFFTKYFGHFVEASEDFTPQEKKELQSVIEDAFTVDDQSLSEIKSGKPIAQMLRIDMHVFSFVLTSTRFYLFNRGSGSEGVEGLIVYELTSEAQLEDLFAKLDLPYKDVVEFNAMITALGLKVIEKECVKMKHQKASNCLWANGVKGVVCALLRHYKKPLALYKFFGAFSRLYGAFTYIEESRIPSPNVLELIAEKLLSKTKKIDNPFKQFESQVAELLTEMERHKVLDHLPATG